MRWVLTAISTFWTDLIKTVDISTDINNHLWLLWSFIPPKRVIAYPERRGTFCRIGEFLWPLPLRAIEQNEGGLTPNHSFTWGPWPEGQTRYYTFYPSAIGTPGHSTAPVFSQTSPEAPPVPISFERLFFNFVPPGPIIPPWQPGFSPGAGPNYLGGALILPVPNPNEQVGVVSIDPAYLRYSITRSRCEATQARRTLITLATTKTTNSNPYYEANNYSFFLTRNLARTRVFRHVAGVETELWSGPWTNVNATLTIEIMFDRIYFYDRGLLRYDEAYALPSYNLYTYLYAWSAPLHVGQNAQHSTLLHRTW